MSVSDNLGTAGMLENLPFSGLFQDQAEGMGQWHGTQPQVRESQGDSLPSRLPGLVLAINTAPVSWKFLSLWAITTPPDEGHLLSSLTNIYWGPTVCYTALWTPGNQRWGGRSHSPQAHPPQTVRCWAQHTAWHSAKYGSTPLSSRVDPQFRTHCQLPA